MLNVIRADAQRTLQEKRGVAAFVLSDIERIVREAAPTAAFVVIPALEALQDELARCESQWVGSLVGPELYRWLALTGTAIRHEDRPAFARHIEQLPSLIFTRLAIGGRKGEYWLPRRGGICELPQAGLSVQLPPTLPLIRARLAEATLTLEDVEIDRGRIRSLVDGASDNNPRLVGGRIYFHQRGVPLTEMVEDLRRTASIPTGHDEEITLIPLEQFSAAPIVTMVENMGKGLSLLRNYATGQADEVESVMDAITLVTGRRFVGGSDIWYQGVAVFNPDLDWSPTTYADHLVHEGAHLALHACNELTPLLRNGQAMGAKSPIRQDPRPIYGILHSVFVFLRLVQFFRNAAPALGTDEALFRLHRHLLGFYEGMGELARHADFTAVGGRLFQDMLAVQSAFKAELPEPDPRFYKCVGKDYVV